jgi:hypothetical protein
VIRLEGKNKARMRDEDQQNLLPAQNEALEEEPSSLNGNHTPMVTGDQFITANMHRQIYPSLELANSTGHTLPAEHTDEEEPTLSGMGVVTDGSRSSDDDFVTAQQTNSKLLQLLTTECSTRASATPTEGEGSGVYISPAAEGMGHSYEELDRPRSVQFKAHSGHPVSKKSPLATNASRAPPLQQDHAVAIEKSLKAPTKTVTVRIKEEAFSPEMSTDPQPSAPPPMDVMHAEIKKVNSYSGLGKRRSLFSQTPPPGKKLAVPEKPAAVPKKNAVSPGRTGVSLSTGALNLAAKMLSHATGRVGLSNPNPADPAGASTIGALLETPPPQILMSSGGGVTSLQKAQGSSSPPTSKVKPSSSKTPASSNQATHLSGRRMSLDSAPRQTPSSFSHSVARNSAAAVAASDVSSPRAKSWLEHLKSKLPIHQ